VTADLQQAQELCTRHEGHSGRLPTIHTGNGLEHFDRGQKPTLILLSG